MEAFLKSAFLAVISLLSMSCLVPEAGAAPVSARCANPEFSALLHEAAGLPPAADRFDKGLGLVIKLKALRVDCMAPRDLGILSHMLRDEDDGVRFLAAMIIANVGQAARDTVPSLEAALAERPCEEKTVTSAGAIRHAFAKLGVDPPPVTCRHF